MSTYNTTILDTFGTSAEDFYNGCIGAGLDPHNELDVAVARHNQGGYSPMNEPPSDDNIIDDEQLALLHDDLDHVADIEKSYQLRLCRYLPDADTGENLLEVESENIMQSDSLMTMATWYRKLSPYIEDDSYYGYEIVELDDDGCIIGTVGGFIKGSVISDYTE